MTQETLNWRSIADQGAVGESWNNPGTPMYYVVDHRGTIRFKWFGYPGERAIDKALHELIQEAEEDARSR